MGLDGKVLSDQTNQIQAAANDRTAVGKLDLDKLAEGHTVLVALKVTDAAGRQKSATTSIGGRRTKPACAS